MAINYNFKNGVDMPSWQWLTQFPGGSSQPGTSNCYDGTRYIYWSIQTGTSTAGSASTTALWRYDTWTNGWQFLTNMTSGNRGIDMEFDFARNIVWITIGVSTTEWRFFNPNLTSVTAAATTATAMSLSAAISTVLPNAASDGTSLAMPTDLNLPATFDTGTCSTGSTTTAINSASSPGTFWSGIVGLQIRFTSGALSGQKRIITGVTDSDTLTVTRAFGGSAAAADAWLIELPADTAASGSTSTTLVTTGGLPTNLYVNSDVQITSGTGSGQRRRIASHDATTLTLAGTVTGNPRTGSWSVTPDATSVYQIVPSSDFLYYLWGNSSLNFSKMDVVATTPAWTSIGGAPAAVAGGGNLMVPSSSAPFILTALRGNSTATVYHYSIGPNSWTTPTILNVTETFSTGAASILLSSRRKLVVQKEGNQRIVLIDLVTGEMTPFPFAPYAAPTANEGHRLRWIKTTSGVEWVYLLRGGGQEFWRIALEWM
jgi:hypothetical protein